MRHESSYVFYFSFKEENKSEVSANLFQCIVTDILAYSLCQF